MSLFKWKQEFETSISSIDEQHKRLVDLINQLFDAMNEAKTKETLGVILNELVNYTKIHFSTEEKLMNSATYSDLENHKLEHKIFINKIDELKSLYEEGNARISISLINFLKDWLLTHILISDKKYVPFLLSRNIK